MSIRRQPKSLPTIAALAVVVALGLAACGSSSDSSKSTATKADAAAATTTTAAGTDAPAGGTKVTIKDYAFSPAKLTVKVGDTVTWMNSDGTTHTATSDDGMTPKFDSGDIKAGADGTVTFDKAGTYAYHCDFHGNMHGTITVK